MEAVQFTVAADCYVTSVGVYAGYMAGTPTDNVRTWIDTDSSGVPSNTKLEEGTQIPASSFSPTAWQFSTFLGTTKLTAGTTYWVVWQRSQLTTDNANYIGFVAGIGGSPPTAYNASGTSWAAKTTNPIDFEVDGTSGGGGGYTPGTEICFAGFCFWK
jgi:hypothetical protein